MSGSTAASAGMSALEKRDYDTAIAKLTDALKTSRSPLWLAARSKAHIGKGDFTRALRDADFSYAAAAARGKRDLMRDAQHRRAVAYMRLGRLADADACAMWVQRMAEQAGVSLSDPALRKPETDERGFSTATKQTILDYRADIERKKLALGSSYLADTAPAGLNAAVALRMQILGQMDKLPADDERRKVTASFAPNVSIDDFEKEEAAAAIAKTDKAADTKASQEDKDDVKAAAAESVRKPAVQADVRTDFYQTNTDVMASVYVKNVPKDEFKVEYGEKEIRMSHIPGHDPWYTIPLYGTIDPAGSKHSVKSVKVEFQLKKAAVLKWPKLKAEPSDVNTTIATPAPAAPTKPDEPISAAILASASGPAYPTSSKSGAKNWDTVLADEKDDDEDKDINLFFKSLYKGATPEQQRAMMKSFTESNGTALSTDWNDVKDRTVETQPPEGVEAKKWEA
ncbi:Protein SGT1-like protein A [Colletotrichum aenigma]|uniref:Protein SGT1-like protein A n=1 Tax=Colletotrichum aenigma TaxID=1215731 RepID=UPI00187337E6|nr:Protein SGT1-like protein A [Colletotrichum aenigma]KAF5524211.1 Protein SGT1-like protein A [Colletotrichum aenigma]